MHEFLYLSASHGNVPSSADCLRLLGRHTNSRDNRNRPSQYANRLTPGRTRVHRDLPSEVIDARWHLRDHGWSYRTAAPVLGVHYSHLAQVLTGTRKSRQLCEAILTLPRRAA